MLHRKLRPEYGHRSFVLAPLSMLGGIAALGGLMLNDTGAGGGTEGGTGEGSGGTGTGSTGSGSTGTTTTSTDEPPAKVFKTQAEYDAEAAKIRRNAEKDAAKKLADTLGMTVEEAKSLIEERKKAEEAALSEVEKRERAAEERAKAAEERERVAADRERRASVALALTAAGVRADRVKRAAATVLDDLSSEADVDDDKVAAAVAKVKEELPEFFGEAQAPPPPAGLNTPGGPRSTGTGNATPMERGRERARALRGTSNNSQSDPFAALGRAVGS